LAEENVAIVRQQVRGRPINHAAERHHAQETEVLSKCSPKQPPMQAVQLERATTILGEPEGRSIRACWQVHARQTLTRTQGGQSYVRRLLQQEGSELFLTGSASQLAGVDEAEQLLRAQQKHGCERLHREAMPFQKKDVDELCNRAWGCSRDRKHVGRCCRRPLAVVSMLTMTTRGEVILEVSVAGASDITQGAYEASEPDALLPWLHRRGRRSPHGRL
jgi:hypothetical protein